MNKQEHSAALAAAAAELARLQAIVPEPEEPLMVLSAERVPRGTPYYIALFTGETVAVDDIKDPSDNLAYAGAAYYSSKAQAEAYARAFSTLRLIRRQPGIVANCSNALPYVYIVTVDGVVAVRRITGCYSSTCMFPCFVTSDAARAAIEAVGAEELVFTANFLAGNITLDNYAAGVQTEKRNG